MNNEKRLKAVRRYALNFLYWRSKAERYFGYDVYKYAPMVKDELFLTVAKQGEVIGVEELEERLGRNLKIEELSVCPLSVNYLLFGNPAVTDSKEESEVLDAFENLIREKVKRYETRAVNQWNKSGTTVDLGH